ncbi:glycosyltransferase family 4 protein [Actinacidiphila guanduensis]|uniref:D-inositol 3-phosphate glycosyltransferase n=1 Tax=Actinacidiphila guanduensis TaxID=310781 RepID=A0A1H0B361_9ACTN|nr:glycosyltransferase family 4 protein [Actinacidiphila guanduensis]SDN40097.1 Glycosyl transferases group 1 [Actinacidiphila guanduensis]
MISFIWSPGNPLPAGTGGSENYTVGQVRELTRRGLPAQVVTVGLGVDDGRDEFTDIPFLSLQTLAEISELDGTVVFVNEPHPVPTMHPAFLILHNPPPIRERERAFAVEGTRDRALIVTSRYAAALWSKYLDIDVLTISVVYPFAEPCFAAQSRPGNATGKTRVLFAGRLSPEKGIYTLLETLHIDVIEQDLDLTFTATTAGADKPQGKIIKQLLGEHPGISVVANCKTPATMAALMADHDIVVMPSNSQYWHETFGIVSIEAQHSGCRVIASNDGGLPETDCGAVSLITPDNAEALAWGIREAVDSGPLSPSARHDAGEKFTVAQSVDTLLEVFARQPPISPATIVAQLEELILAPSAQVQPVIHTGETLTRPSP